MTATGTGLGDADPHTGVPRSSGRTPIFRGWKIAGSSAIILAFQSSLILQAFGNYAVVLQDRFGWSKSTISVAYSFNRAESGLLGPAHGWAIQRFGTKRVMQLGAVIVVAGFMWFSQMSSPVSFVLSFFVIAIGAGLSGFMTVNTEVVRWFERRRARALSLTSIGIAAGGLFAPVLVAALTHLGWRTTAALSGLALGAVTLAMSRLFGSSPAEHGLPIDGLTDPPAAVGRQGASLSAAHLTAGQAVRTSAFWFLAIGHASALLVVGSVIAHLSLFLTEEQGYTLQGASFVLAGITVSQVVGMLLGGAVGDRLDKRWLCVAAMFGHASGLLMLTFAASAAWVWCFVVLHGLAWGMRGPLMSAIRADYFGSSAFAQIMGYTSMVLMVGVVGGPLFAGVLADVTGSYRTGFTILAVLAGSGSVMFALAKPPEPPSAPLTSG